MNTTNVQKHLSLLGHQVQDAVTKTKGVVTTISFDLYGCIQAVVHPGLDKDNKQMESHWFDVNRLKILSKKTVMQPPNFEFGVQAEGWQGAAEKPKNNRH